MLSTLLFNKLRSRGLGVTEVAVSASAIINPKEVSGDEPISSEGLMNFKLIVMTKPRFDEGLIHELVRDELFRCPITRVMAVDPQIIYVS
ncbi:MAG TPA: hypothetical protein ENF75_02380 [Acidilobales archaeon]|nr:hypothetical protein [Acidilobales archaeon]